MLAGLVFMAVLAQNASSPEAVVRQAQEDMRLGKFSVACQKLEEAIRASPRNPALWFMVGLGRSQLKEFDPAVNAFKKVIEIDPRFAPAYFNLGLLYGYKGDPDQALGMYRRGLEIEPADLGANQNYAYLLMRTQRYGEAVAPLRRLVSAKGSDLSVRSALIECLVKSGRNSEARNETQEFLRIPGATESDKFDLAKVLFENGDLDSAQVVLQHLVASSPESADAHGKLGLILSRKNSAGRIPAFRPGQTSSRYPNAPEGFVFPGDAGVGDGATQNTYGNISPRISLAWQPGALPNTSIRASFGMFVAPPAMSTYNHAGDAPPFAPSYPLVPGSRSHLALLTSSFQPRRI